MIWVIMLYIINNVRLIKAVNNEVGRNDNKAGRGSEDYVFALKTNSRIASYVAAALLGFSSRMTSLSTRSVYSLISHQINYLTTV